MRKLSALMLLATALTALCGVSEAQLPAHLAHSIGGPNGVGVGDCSKIASFTPGVGMVAGDSQTPCTPSLLTTAYTNSTTSYTPILSLPIVQGSTTLAGKCTLIWESSSTSGTVTFAAGLSAAPTDLWVTAAPTGGAFVAPTFTTITGTSTTAVTGALATTAANTAYQVQLSFTLANATTANTLTIYALSNNASYAASVLPGSFCAWIP